MFSKACEHGIKAMIYIATQSTAGRRVKLGDIAQYAGSPEAFTAKVLGALSKAGLLVSMKGPAGGFGINRADGISVKSIVQAIDGNRLFTGCALGLQECDATRPCPMHYKFIAIRDELNYMLENTNLEALATGLKSGASFLLR
ncbi:MAG: Rrf2 family transcriptional regulator [Sphingobacteriales bacterium]|nr:MAG: Rrf2 family transcriptional regulator [Sphingobacteriales bacterium]